MQEMAVRRYQRRAVAYSGGQARKEMRTCVTCGAELHPERAKKYDYCMSPECQKKNLKGLTMVAVGVNKAAEQYLLLDEDTKAELASGKYHDQRRGSFGTSSASPSTAPSAGASPAAGATPAADAAPASGASPAAGATPAADAAPPSGASPAAGSGPGRTAGRARNRPQGARLSSRPSAAAKTWQPWTSKQARLALLYNEQGMRPEEIAQKLGLSSYAVTQIILTARNRGKL
jgi:hypothetical protein